MPATFKALILVLAVALPTFIVLKGAIVSLGGREEDFNRRRNAFIAITLVLFLSPSFWLFAFATGAIVYFAARQDANPLALYMFTLVAVPTSISLNIPGFGLINYLFAVNHSLLLALMVLLPIAAQLYRTRHDRPSPLVLLDLCVIAFIIITLIGQLRADSFTNSLRIGFHRFTDIWLVYYVASRGFASVTHFREAMASFVIVMAAFGLLAVYESSAGWVLYDTIRHRMDVSYFLHPLHRDGFMRAILTGGHSIIFGYLMMIALAAFLFISNGIRWKLAYATLLCAILSGLYFSLSRGPWLGAAIVIATWVLLMPGAAQRVKALAGLAVGGALVLITPLGSSVVRLLPFFGTVGEGSVEYRERLWDASMIVFWQNPMFGDFDYLSNPVLQPLRGGLGNIIDMVNTYLIIALQYGLVGVVSFVLALGLPILAVLRSRSLLPAGAEDAERCGRMLIAVMLGILFTIFTVSPIFLTATMFWLFAGFCAGYASVHAPSPAPAVGHLSAGLRRAGQRVEMVKGLRR